MAVRPAAESDKEDGRRVPPVTGYGKIRYLQGTHDARAGDIRDVAQPCAEVLVRLERRSTSRCDVRQVIKRNVMRSMANVEPFTANPKKPEIRT